MNRRAFLLLSTVTVFGTVTARADAKTTTVAVATPRVTVGQLSSRASAAQAEVDLGPAPAPNGSRIITDQQILDALADSGNEPISGLPKSTRVVREMRTVTAQELKKLTQQAIDERGLKKGMTLAKISPPQSRKIAAGWDTVTIRLPRPPKRPGQWATTGMLYFDAFGERIATIAVRLTFDLTEEATRPDIKKGAPLTLTVKSRRVEVSIKAHAGADADVGDTFSVQLRPSGRMVRAKLVEPQRAVAIGGVA